MTPTSSHFEWAFGGWMAPLSPWLQWAILGLMATAGLGLIVWSYARTLAPLSPAKRWTLRILRLLFFIGLLIFLANPARVERRQVADVAGRPLAVLVDQSVSMKRPDNRGQSRQDHAVREWAKILPAAREHFPSLDYAGFAASLQRTGSLEQAIAGKGAPETRMLASLGEALRSAPVGGYGAILCLTDGLDTTDLPTGEIINQALAAQTPLYFVIGENRLRSAEKLRIRECKAPVEVLQKTAFDFQTIVESYSATARKVPVRLLQNGQSLAEGQLEIPEGPGVTVWKASVNAGDPGTLALELKVGDAPAEKIAHREVRVVRQMRMSLLYYQGALDWGYRFLQNIFRRDPSFEISSILNPQLGMKLRAGNNALDDLPAEARELQAFSVVVLDSVFANQLSDEQQKALEEYVRDGGAVLFIAHDTLATQAFSGSRLEAILPIVFARATANDQAARNTNRFREQMQTAASAAGGGSSTPADQSTGLQPFAFPEGSPLRELLTRAGANGNRESIIPQFAEYASIERAKPGATVLGIHPTEKDAKGNPKILLAVQRFGKGRVAALATDSLWRWKLSLPADSPDPAVFWQQFMMWLAGSASRSLRFADPPVEVPLNRTTSLIVESVEAPQVTAQTSNQPTLPLEVKPDAERGQWRMAWRPTQIGEWTITAATGGGEQRIFINVTDVDSGGIDLENLPPDGERLRELADATGGEILARGAPGSWLAPVEENGLPPLPESRSLQWNRWPWLLLVFALYSVELGLRRWWRLL